ncbi:MAG: IPT/TIG domain-containing protein [Armatimonadetes bacterium]|nr:IPT/TIG domain-containing protein [Armatimonadota bacterium]
MPKLRFRILLVSLLLVAASLPGAAEAPVLNRLMPDIGPPGATIFVTGKGFGTDKKRVRVLFDGQPGGVAVVRDESLAVAVPWGVPRVSQVTVEVDGQSSNALPYNCTTGVRVTVDKNPLERGETTTGTFRVYHDTRPVQIRFKNTRPDVVSFVGGEEQTVTTSGGEENVFSFQIEGKVGNQLYGVDYSWEPVGPAVAEEDPDEEEEEEEGQEDHGFPIADAAHHCQGGRLVVVVGGFEDGAIAGALKWTYNLSEPHVHKVAFSALAKESPNLDIPYVPGEDGSWERYKLPGKDGKKSDKNGGLKPLVAGWQDCCFFQEVLVFMHGHQAGGWAFVRGGLPFILNNRPVKKLVLWTCESSNHFVPGKGGDNPSQTYRWITWLARPAKCPCDCDPTACKAGYLGGLCPGEDSGCPKPGQPTTILTSGSVAGTDIAAKLGINPEDDKSPFTSPDGRVRVMTVTPKGANETTVTAEMSRPEADVAKQPCIFLGKKIKADPGIQPQYPAKVPEKTIAGPDAKQDVSTTDIKKLPGSFKNPYGTGWEPRPFAGPKCVKPPGDGCLPGPPPKSPKT